MALWRGGRALGATWGVWGGCIVGMHVQVCEYLPSRVSLTTKQRDLIKAEEWGKRKPERIFFSGGGSRPTGPDHGAAKGRYVSLILRKTIEMGPKLGEAEETKVRDGMR